MPAELSIDVGLMNNWRMRFEYESLTGTRINGTLQHTLWFNLMCIKPCAQPSSHTKEFKLGEILKLVFANEGMHPGQCKHSPKYSSSPGHFKCWLASLTGILGQVRGQLSPLPTFAYHERNECVYGCAGNASEWAWLGLITRQPRMIIKYEPEAVNLLSELPTTSQVITQWQAQNACFNQRAETKSWAKQECELHWKENTKNIRKQLSAWRGVR